MTQWLGKVWYAKALEIWVLDIGVALACWAMWIVGTMLMLEATCMNDRYESLFGMLGITRQRSFIELDIFDIVRVSQWSWQTSKAGNVCRAGCHAQYDRQEVARQCNQDPWAQGGTGGHRVHIVASHWHTLWTKLFWNVSKWILQSLDPSWHQIHAPLRSPAFISFCKIADINFEAGEKDEKGWERDCQKSFPKMTEATLEYGMWF